MTCIASSLKSNDYIRLFTKHVCNFTFTFIAPVGTYYCSYHLVSS